MRLQERSEEQHVHVKANDSTAMIAQGLLLKSGAEDRAQWKWVIAIFVVFARRVSAGDLHHFTAKHKYHEHFFSSHSRPKRKSDHYSSRSSDFTQAG